VPKSFDVWTIEAVAALVEEMRTVNPDLQAFGFLNRADPYGTDNSDAGDFISENPTLEFIDTPLFYRKAYSNAAAAGLSVMELRPKNPKAVEEVTALYRRAFSAPVFILPSGKTVKAA
jgi:chromosome partitioning protein